ncbi:hypothetical protein [uncultured Campylobacter sp.]|uniref:hypothetical protein n=1 Tax=uncultured Campylobacter sp. TaxID=218934 RepID=UPI0025E90CEE|nr:hypothetical protein [uncultured Campylobacter sp.]
MNKLVFTPSKLCFSADDEVMLKAFKKHLHIYKVASLDGVAQPLLDCAYDLFHIVQTQRKSIKKLEIKEGIREEKNL